MSGIDPNVTGPQRLECGCVVEVRFGSPLYGTTCQAASGMFVALSRSPAKNQRQCAERDALRKHIGFPVTD